MNSKTKIGSLELNSPIIAASGVWPYMPEFWKYPKLDGIGAICTKAISLNPRQGNSGVRVWETPSGLMNTIGLQNIGVKEFVNHYSEQVKDCPCHVIANIVMERIDETVETVNILKDVEGIAALELNISCPNVDGDGMAWGMECNSAVAAVRAVRKVWGGNLWVKTTPQASKPVEIAKAIEAEGADAIVCANTWLGMAIDMQTGKPAFNRVVGGLSGPAIFPLALRLVWQNAMAVSIPIIGCGGVSSASDCIGMILAGASAVETGTAFLSNLNFAKEVCHELPNFISRYKAENLTDLIGFANK